MASQNHEPSIALVLSLAPAVPLGCPSLCLGNVKKNHEVNGKSLKEIYAEFSLYTKGIKLEDGEKEVY